MYSILVVDDNKTNLQLVKQVLSSKYSVIPVLSGEMAIQYVEKKKPDLILLDQIMPELDGMSTMERIRSLPFGKDVPVIFLTADTDKETEVECLRRGAFDFIAKPFAPEVMISRIDKTLELESLRHELQKQLEEKSKQVERMTLQAIMNIANTIDAKDELTRNHSVKVAEYATAIAEKLGWAEEEIQNLHYVALLHDIGKIGVSDEVLNKPTRLTKEEFELVKRHAAIGGEILKDVKMVKDVIVGALYHHERYDGKGYPKGLKGEEIPLIARIVGLAEAYEAMTSRRVYREELTEEEVRVELELEKGKQFDPVLVDALLTIIEEGTVKHLIEGEASVEVPGIVKQSNVLLQRILEEQSIIVRSAASIDPLTEIYNRRYLAAQINIYFARQGNEGSFFIFDLDNFKGINDTYGHMAGDEVLKIVAKLLKNNARENDIVCRMGGDEFVIFYPGLVEWRALERRAKQIIEAFTEIGKTHRMMRGTSISIGIATSSKECHDFETLYQNADKALYFVKQNGKSSYHFYNGMSYSESFAISN